jgi:hypothetical protein
MYCSLSYPPVDVFISEHIILSVQKSMFDDGHITTLGLSLLGKTYAKKRKFASTKIEKFADHISRACGH